MYGIFMDVNSGNMIWGVNFNVGGLFGIFMGILFDGDVDIGNIFNGDLVGLMIVDIGGIDIVDLLIVIVD